jgi:hypothetical protein
VSGWCFAFVCVCRVTPICHAIVRTKTSRGRACTSKNQTKVTVLSAIVMVGGDAVAQCPPCRPRRDGRQQAAAAGHIEHAAVMSPISASRPAVGYATTKKTGPAAPFIWLPCCGRLRSSPAFPRTTTSNRRTRHASRFLRLWELGYSP